MSKSICIGCEKEVGSEWEKEGCKICNIKAVCEAIVKQVKETEENDNEK